MGLPLGRRVRAEWRQGPGRGRGGAAARVAAEVGGGGAGGGGGGGRVRALVGRHVLVAEEEASGERAAVPDLGKDEDLSHK